MAFDLESLVARFLHPKSATSPAHAAVDSTMVETASKLGDQVPHAHALMAVDALEQVAKLAHEGVDRVEEEAAHLVPPSEPVAEAPVEPVVESEPEPAPDAAEVAKGAPSEPA